MSSTTTWDTTFKTWWTMVEYSLDERTGAIAAIKEDRPTRRWKWRVEKNGLVASGMTTTQKNARAACRRAARKLPAK